MITIPELGPRLSNFTVTDIIRILKTSILLPNHTASKILEPEFYDIPNESPTGSQFDDSRYWSNPFHYTLPSGRMKVYCGYGVGKETERAYYYTLNQDDLVGPYKIENTTARPYFFEPASANLSLTQQFINASLFPIVINTSVTNETLQLQRGVRYTDGDGTVPLLSTGFMCVNAWKTKKYNPSNCSVVTREYLHDPVSLVASVRGGPKTSDHVDILGNYQMTLDILQIVSGNDDSDSQDECQHDQTLGNETKHQSTKSSSSNSSTGSDSGSKKALKLCDMIHSNIKQFAARVQV